MHLVRSLQTWNILLIYCNNQLKKYITPLPILERGALSVPLLMSMSEAFSVPFHTLIKLCYTKVLEWSSLVPSPKAKSSSEITNSNHSPQAIILGACLGSSKQGKDIQSSSLPVLSVYFYFTNSTMCLCVWLMESLKRTELSMKQMYEAEPYSAVSRCLEMTEGCPQIGSFVRGLYWLANAKRHPMSLREERPEMGEACGPNFPFSVTFSWSLTIP